MLEAVFWQVLLILALIDICGRSSQLAKTLRIATTPVLFKRSLRFDRKRVVATKNAYSNRESTSCTHPRLSCMSTIVLHTLLRS
jgi:hypothetical protein